MNIKVLSAKELEIVSGGTIDDPDTVSGKSAAAAFLGSLVGTFFGLRVFLRKGLGQDIGSQAIQALGVTVVALAGAVLAFAVVEMG